MAEGRTKSTSAAGILRKMKGFPYVHYISAYTLITLSDTIFAR